jgi:phosphatidylserine/phosphatidylglycerophosphate/cardiolipin synthase-like enzyme
MTPTNRPSRILPLVRTRRLRARAHLCNHSVTRGGASQGMKLMHSKFVVRDGQAVWTGSANMTDDAFTLMENNIVEIDSQPLASYYAQNFEQLWEKQNFENTGDVHTEPVPLTFSNQSANAR